MCGIAGLVGPEPCAALLETVERMLAALAHRGPDDAGTFAFTPPEPGVAASAVLGNRRLAIIDLTAGGHQPMVSPDGRHAIVLNGEIYNYLELRRELEGLGHRFRSRSDTEVLLAAVAQWGASCLPRLVGMFAFAVLDMQTRRLILARDGFGMKPLYYTARPGHLAFSSEIPPLLDTAGLPRRANPRRVYEYLDRGATDHGDETLFAGVHALPAAHYADVSLQEPGDVRPVRYWTPDLEREAELSFSAAVERLRELFLESVALHMRSDVPIGTLLSGGIDSSAIVMAMRHLGGHGLDLHTFSYIGGQGAISEEPWIDLVNRAAGATGHKVYLEPHDWSADAGRLMQAQHEPFGSLAVYAQHRVFRRAAEAGVKVVLDGQGADELLAGYRAFLVTRFASLLARGRWTAAGRLFRGIARARQPFEPAPLRTLLSAIATMAPPPIRWGARRVLGRDRHPWIDPAWCQRHGLEPDHRQRSVLTPPKELRLVLWRAIKEGSLPPLLRFEDRNGMTHSIESRLPFLTPQLAEFLLALPAEYLIAPDGTSKRIFREAMRGIVPDQVLARRDKIGFAVPIHSWLPAIPDTLDLLETAARLPPVQSEAIEPYLGSLRSGQVLSHHASFLTWRLVGLAAWVRHCNVTLD